ncbi:hypothetical protein [Streptomyces xantholiticus]|uniref:hypothetical protein n=1 Tax=Streptomyces xantholiticus TaxID=68285 RepID=UPI0019A9C43B|nr:hypothetical protein [Streptomyces xantholiticus]GGW25677.1 hypothetical protein GCM10010381_06850 [Streptomyces xantholiticus]
MSAPVTDPPPLSAECTLGQRPGYKDVHRQCRQTKDVPLPHSNGAVLLVRAAVPKRELAVRTALVDCGVHTTQRTSRQAPGREAHGGAQPVMCGYPAPYDWMFLYWYQMRFTGSSPFGHSGCLDMKTLYATKARLPLRAVSKGTMPRELLSRRRHTHHALDDAIEQAELFSNLMTWPGV